MPGDGGTESVPTVGVGVEVVVEFCLRIPRLRGDDARHLRY